MCLMDENKLSNSKSKREWIKGWKEKKSDFKTSLLLQGSIVYIPGNQNTVRSI